MTTANTSPSATPSLGAVRPTFVGLLGQAMLGGLVALAGNLLVYFGGRAAGVTFTAEFQPGVVSGLLLPAVAASCFLPGVVAAGLALLFQKYTAQAARNFAVLAAVFTLVSFGGPANLKQISTGTLVALDLMHVVAALGIGGALYRALKKQAT